MAALARRCTNCSLNYPPYIDPCRICGDSTWPMWKSGPDEDWEQRVAGSLGEGVYLEPKKAYGFAHPREDISVPVTFREDRLWIRHADLTEGGYTNLEAGSIVWVNGSFYELQGRSKVVRNADYSWWVEEIVTEGAADDLTPAMFTVWKPDEND